MLLKEFISEVIQTSVIDQAARKIVDSAFHDNINSIVKYLTSLAKPKKDEHGELDYSDLYDQVETIYRDQLSGYKKLQEIYNPILATMSASLTKLVKGHLPSVLARSGWKDDEGVKDLIINKAIVEFEIKEYSQDPHANKAGGYAGNDKMKLFISEKYIYQAILELIQENMLGDRFTNTYPTLIKYIVSTFSHEYAHIEQGILDPRGIRNKDFGYITTGEKKRGGKRGGIMRTPWESPTQQVRYLGSSHEIDSFASGAASEMVQNLISQKGRWNINDIIDYIYDEMKYGENQSPSANRYRELLHNTFNGAYADVGVKINPQEVKKVYQRFLKLVYQKLNNYRTKDNSHVDPKWTQAVENQSRTDAIKSIAMMAIKDIRKQAKSWEYDDQKTIAEIKDGKFTYSEEDFLIDAYKIGIDKEGWKKPTGFEQRFRDYVAKLYSMKS